MDAEQLLRHAEWADALVWKAVPDRAREDTELREKLYHMHSVQWTYLHVWRGEPLELPELTALAAPGSLRAWARDYYRELLPYLLTVRESDVTREVHFPWVEHLVERFGKVGPVTWAESVLQIALHSSHHRGQVARRLRELGVEPPLTDFLAWVWMGRPEADWDGPA